MSESKQNIIPINTYDLDGVISIGLTPRPEDIIITGRSYEEAPETYRYLHKRGIYNAVYFSPVVFEKKTREISGIHKGTIINYLMKSGNHIEKHFEDDEVQKAEIEKMVDIPVIHLVHDLTIKENVRHLDE